MSLPAFSVKHRFLANMLMIIATIWGFMAYRSMPKDRFPDVSVDTIMVSTVMPGASPKEMEELITIPLEEEIAKVDGIDEMTLRKHADIAMYQAKSEGRNNFQFYESDLSVTTQIAFERLLAG